MKPIMSCQIKGIFKGHKVDKQGGREMGLRTVDNYKNDRDINTEKVLQCLNLSMSYIGKLCLKTVNRRT